MTQAISLSDAPTGASSNESSEVTVPSNMCMKKTVISLVAGAAMVMAISARANTITFDTGATSIGGTAVHAEAVVTTGVDSLTIILKNLQADPAGVAACISGLGLTLSSGQTAGTLTSSSGMERSVFGDGTFHDGSAVATGWEEGLLGVGVSVDVLGTPTAPRHTIIGDAGTGGLYTGNNSILGNGPHNPFLVGDVTFVLTVPGLTAADTATSATFQFGTATGSSITERSPPVPDGGTTVALLGLAMIGLEGLRRRSGGR